MSSLFFLLVLTTVFAAAIADPEMEAFAQKVIQMVNPADQHSNNTQLLKQLTNGEDLTYKELMNKKQKHFTISVSFVGSVELKMESEGKTLTITQAYVGGVGLAVGAQSSSDVEVVDPSQQPKPVNAFIDKIHKQNVDKQKTLADNEIGYLVLHGSATGLSAKDNTNSADVGFVGGLAMGSIARIDKNY